MYVNPLAKQWLTRQCSSGLDQYNKYSAVIYKYDHDHDPHLKQIQRLFMVTLIIWIDSLREYDL